MIGTLTCPECKGKQEIEIPKKACLPFYKCNSCSKVIKSVKSCCVFCDYGNKKCPAAKEHKK